MAVEKLGRRPLLVASILVEGVSICGLGVYFYLSEQATAGKLDPDTVTELGEQRTY